MKKILIGNWKMQLTPREGVRLAEAVSKGAARAAAKIEIAVCPSHTALALVRTKLKRVGLGAQDAFWAERGAFTGEVGLAELKELSVEHVIVGHSERRALGESNEVAHATLHALVVQGFTPVLCVGESDADCKAGRCHAVVERELRAALRGVKPKPNQKIVIAYEPLWAIGTGRACDPVAAKKAIDHARRIAVEILGAAWAKKNLRVVYGGSVSVKNAAGYAAFASIDGALVGGGSLKAAEFLKIAAVLAKR